MTISCICVDFEKQIVFAGVGLLALGFAVAAPHPLWERLSPFLYVIALALLVAVLVVGTRGGGATRWIALGGFRFQPSEPAKICAVLLLARHLAGRRRPIEGFAGLVIPVMIALVPMALVLLLLLELGGASAWLLHGLGIALLAGRLVHAWSLAAHNGTGRIIGMGLTFGALVVAAIGNLEAALGVALFG